MTGSRWVRKSREDQLWSNVLIITSRYCRYLVSADIAYANDPVRRLDAIANTLADYRKELEPHAVKLREQCNVGPNDWIQRIVGFIFGIGGSINDRAWWARTLTEWWEEWRLDAERIKHGF
jgi:hypothetical protein